MNVSENWEYLAIHNKLKFERRKIIIFSIF
jgi:hypothetical protein